MPLEGVVPFPEEFSARYRQRGYWEDRPLGEALRQCFRRYGNRVAIIAGEQRVTYRELEERSERLALHLLDLDTKPLDRVIMQLPNVPEFIYLYVAFLRVGAIPLMALPPHRLHEIGYYAEAMQARAYAIPDTFGGFRFTDLAREVRARSPTLEHVLVVGEDVPEGFLPVKELLLKGSRTPPSALEEISIDPTDPAVFQLSGGTTGIPKMIPRTHNDYLYNSKASAAVNDIRPDDALLVVLPLAHNFPLASPGIQGFFLRGARVVLGADPRPEAALPLIESHRVTHIELVPALLLRWLQHPALGVRDLSSVRIINTGGQKLQPEVKQRTEKAIPSATVQEVFGMAEGLLMFVRLDDPEEVRMETVGRPVCPDDEVKLLDDDGQEVPPGEIGELACRGPYTLRGYYRAPEHNARAFTEDGFYLSGDLLRLHPSGNYVVEGRSKDLINRGGEKISAEEVENLILAHPKVHNVACVPMPDPILGERTCAFVIPAPGETLRLEELTGYLLDKGVAKFKLPERLELVEEFPLSPFGKVSKKDLAARIARTLEEERARAGRDP